jgi:hypothetical protein
MLSLGMLVFLAVPLAVNGVFAVAKDEESDRLIIDAQPANILFDEPPHAELPNPAHIVLIQVPRGECMATGKSDLSNFYHHLGLPEWMWPYFCLPPLTAEELASLGLDPTEPFPACVTLPMGFSHAVFLANTAHEHVVYSSGALRREDSLLCSPSPLLSFSAVLHGIVIDDLFLFSLGLQLATGVLERVLAAYAAAGFVVKQSKVVRPTLAAVKVLGFEVGGPLCMVQLPFDAARGLLAATLAVLRRDLSTGLGLRQLIGGWLWWLLLRRPALSVLQHSFRFMEVAGRRRFSLWPCVRRELCVLLGLAPLLHARLDASVHPHALASDASELAGGLVVSTPAPALRRMLGPLCSSRFHAVAQTLLRGPARDVSPEAALAAREYERFYAAVRADAWNCVVSFPWRGLEHINVLELRAVLLTVHWLLSFPSAHGRRAFLLVDSTAAYFSLWKGRSSSPSLLRVLRKIAALLLASGSSLMVGWVPTDVNPADGASRLVDRPRGGVGAS